MENKANGQYRTNLMLFADSHCCESFVRKSELVYENEIFGNRRQEHQTIFSGANMMSHVFLFIVKADASVIVEHSGEWIRFPALRVTDALQKSHCSASASISERTDHDSIVSASVSKSQLTCIVKSCGSRERMSWQSQIDISGIGQNGCSHPLRSR